jgi:hypothetical protein
MTRTAISPRLAMRIFLNMRAGELMILAGSFVHLGSGPAPRTAFSKKPLLMQGLCSRRDQL